MRLLLVAIVAFSLGADLAFAQMHTPNLSPLRLHDSGMADCIQMWDSGTHMTKQEWSRTCRRVQTRLDSLDVDANSPKTKTQVR